MNDETRWQDALESEELRLDPSLANLKSHEDLAKGYVELKAYQGRSMKLPGDEPTPDEKAGVVAKLKEKIPGIMIMPDAENAEDVSRFWGELGRPEDIEGYNPPADFEVLDEDLMKQLKDISHKAGLTTDQYHNVLQQYSEASAEIADNNATERAANEAQLKQTWGGAYDDNIQITDAMVEQFQDKDVKLGELNNAARIFMLNVAKSLSSDPQAFKQVNEPKKGKAPAEIRLDLEDMMQQLNDPGITGQRRKNILKKYEAGYKELERYAPQ